MAGHRPRECPVCRGDVELGRGVWVIVKGRDRMAHSACWPRAKHPACWPRAKVDKEEAARC